MSEERWVTINGKHVLIGSDGVPVRDEDRKLLNATFKNDPAKTNKSEDGQIKKAYTDINPGYSDKGPTSINCTACVSAFEANMRGGNTCALPFNEWKHDYKWKDVFGLKNSDGWGYSNRLDRNNVIKNIKMDMEDFGVGSRAIVEYKWDVVGEKRQMVQGHVINVIQTESGTKFIDSQAGKMLSDKDILKHYKRGTVTLYRVDDRPINNDILKKAVKNK